MRVPAFVLFRRQISQSPRLDKDREHNHCCLMYRGS